MVDGVEGHGVHLDEDLLIEESRLRCGIVLLQVFLKAAFGAVVLPCFHCGGHCDV